MNRFTLPLLLLPLHVAVADNSPSTNGTLFFNNGDRIPGVWKETRPNGKDPLFLFDSPYLNETSSIKSSAVNSIVWDKERTPASAPALVELKNGDELSGTIEEFSSDQIVLVNPHLGKLTIPREQISTIKFNTHRKTLYFGTYSLKGWMLKNKNAWEVRDDSFFNKARNAEMTRQMDMPEKVHVSASFSGKNYIQNEIKLWAPEPDSDSSVDSISVSIVYNQISVERNGPNGYKQIMALNSRELTTFPFRMDIFADRGSETYLIYINGKLLNVNTGNILEDEEEEEDNARPAPGKNNRQSTYGTCLMMRFYELESSIKDLDVTEWDGTPPGNLLTFSQSMASGGSAPSDVQQDDATGVVYLRNGDVFKGNVSQDDNHLLVESKLYKVKLPVELVANVTLPTQSVKSDGKTDVPHSGSPQESSNQPGLPVRVFMTDGSVLTAGFMEMKDSSLSLSIPYSGHAVLNLAPVIRIAFHAESDAKDDKKPPRR